MSVDDEFTKLCDLLSKGPLFNVSFENYLYLVKEKNKKVRLDFNKIENALMKHIPMRLQDHFQNVDTFIDFIEIVQERNIKSKNELELKNNTGVKNKNENFKKSDKNKNNFEKKSNVQCFICAGQHYSNVCPSKNKMQEKRKSIRIQRNL